MQVVPVEGRAQGRQRALLAPEPLRVPRRPRRLGLEQQQRIVIVVVIAWPEQRLDAVRGRPIASWS